MECRGHLRVNKSRSIFETRLASPGARNKNRTRSIRGPRYNWPRDSGSAVS